MAGQPTYKRNAVTYYFEGDTVDLEHAMHKITTLMEKSVKALEKYQDGTLTAVQKKQVRDVEHLRDILQRAWDAGQKLSGEQLVQLKRTGRQAFSIVGSMQKEALRQRDKYDAEIKKKQNAELEAEKKHIAERNQLLSPANQMMVSQRASFLEKALVDKNLQGSFTPESKKEITDALAAYKGVLDGTIKSTELQAIATEQLNNAYIAYGRTLKSIQDTVKKEKNEETKRIKEQQAYYDSMMRLASRARKEMEEDFYQTTVAGQESAAQNASFLKSLSDELRSFMSQDAYDEVQRAADHFRAMQAAFKEGTITEKELREATIELQNTYSNYADTLRTVRQSFLAANKSIKSFHDAIAKTKSYLTVQMQSVTTWLRLIRVAASYMKQGIQYAADYVESLNFLNVATGNSIEHFKEFTRLQRLALGLDPTELNETVATFYSFANAIGFVGDNATKASEGLTMLAADMASLYNTDLKTMMTSIKSGMAGNTRAMMKYGISVHDTTIEEWLLEKGLTKSMDKMSEASQAMARYAFIIDKTTAAQGDLARTIQSPANQMRILSNQVKLLMQNMGAFALVVVGPVLRALNMVLQPLNAFLTALTSLSMEGITGSVSEASDDLEDLTDSAEAAVKGLSGLDEINQMSTNKKVTATIDADIQALFDATQYDNLVDKIAPLIDAFDKLGTSLAPVFNALGAPLDIAIDNISFIINMLGGVFNLLSPIFNLVAWFGENVLQPVNTWLEYMGTHLETVIPLLTAVLAIMAMKKWGTFAEALHAISSGFFDIVKSIAKALKSLVTWIVEQTVAIAQAIKQAVANWIAEKSYWKLALAIIAAAGIMAAVVASIVGMAVAAGAATEASNETKTQPHLAKGGVVTGPTLALVGEGAYDEAVIPLGNSPQMRDLQQGIAERVIQTQNNNYVGGSGLGGPTSVQLNIDGRALGRASINNINKVRRQVGVDIK